MSALELAGLILLVLVAAFWMDALGAREVCLAAAREACGQECVQLLDESVAVERMRLARDEEGRLGLRREYVFEFSRTGTDRELGHIGLQGRRVVWLDLVRRRPLTLVC